MRLMPQPKQEKFLRSSADIAIFGGSAFGGKGLRNKTLIPTPSGWVILADIQDGDKVFDENGDVRTVIKAHDPYMPEVAYRLTFDDGSTAEICSEHYWVTFQPQDLSNKFCTHNEWIQHTSSTQEIADTLLTDDGKPNHAIWLCDTRYNPYNHILPVRIGRWIYITACERIEPVMMRCLTVDSPSRLYLAGPSAIPTHNTFALLMECSRYSEHGNFGAVIFRRESKQVDNEGGLRDTALQLYAGLAEYRSQPQKQFIFPSGYRVSLAHLNQDTDVVSWHGSQIGLLCFDELTTFTESMFFYMMSRNRSTSGIKPQCRCTCNPDSDSWVAKFIDWWIDQESGFPIQERSGSIRYLLRRTNSDGVFGLNWASSRDVLLSDLGFGKPSESALADAKIRHQRFIENGQSPMDGTEEMAYLLERQAIKSVTFIPATIYDNPIGMGADPSYIANLKAQNPVDRARLLDGNWKVRPAAGSYFPDHRAVIIDEIPKDVTVWVRSWDLAATEPSESEQDPDYTVGALIGRRPNGTIVVADVMRFRKSANMVREMVKANAIRDGKNVLIYIPTDPGQAGRYQISSYREWLGDFTVISKVITKNKVAMAEPAAAMWQNRLIHLVRGEWNVPFIKELDLFDTGRYDDQVDALTGGISVLPQSAPEYNIYTRK